MKTKMKMVNKGGKMVPAFAADGKGKMMMGGSKMKKMGTGGMHMMPDGSMMKNSMMKTGGMVNPNANLQAAKTAGSKGVMSGVNPKASASKVAKGKVGGISKAPKTAMPKAKYGMTMKKMQDGGPTGNSPENQIKRSMIKSSFDNARKTIKGRSGKPAGKI